MYSSKDVCAVIVSYNPDETIKKNVEMLRKQTSMVIIYDNFSQRSSIEILKSFDTYDNVKVFFCEQNLGIPQRLSEAMEWAHNNRFPLLLTMDQDTILENDCVNQMISTLNKKGSIVSVGPNRKHLTSENGYVITDYLITSGNLLVVGKLFNIHPFWEELFIDLVDIETSLFIRFCGYDLAIATNAFMNHKVGEYEEKKILWIKHRYLSHSAKRFEFIYRNLIIVLRLYFKLNPRFCLKLSICHFIDFAQILFEKDALKKAVHIIKGIKVGLTKNITERKEDLYAARKYEIRN